MKSKWCRKWSFFSRPEFVDPGLQIRGRNWDPMAQRPQTRSTNSGIGKNPHAIPLSSHSHTFRRNFRNTLYKHIHKKQETTIMTHSFWFYLASQEEYRKMCFLKISSLKREMIIRQSRFKTWAESIFHPVDHEKQ